MDTRTNEAEVMVIGGSYAGLSAALQLARARRRVVVVDAGLRRNRFAAASHGFLTQDGRAPGDIAAQGREQLRAYPNAQWVDGTASHAARSGGGFEVEAGGRTWQVQRLVLALGVTDTLPPIDGLAERWGRHVFHCPYCHGYELNEGRVGVLASSDLAMHHALMLPDWGTVTLFLNDAFEPDAAQAQALAKRGVAVETTRIARIVDDATVELQDGRRLVMDGLFTATRTNVSSDLPLQLGCTFDAGPTGAYLRVGEMMDTTVPGVFACGDAARAAGNVALSVGAGAMAGASAHRSLMFETLG